MDLSVVTTVYHSAPYLEEFHARICATAEKITDNYEIVFVNDGSPDNSLNVVLSLYEKDEKVRVIDLSRNFGHYKAIMTGLAHARGKLVFLLDCDLEEAPELLETFYNKLKSSKADVIYGVQETRRGSFLEQITGNLFTHLIDENDRILGQKDSPPMNGTYPTTKWRVGDIVVDRYEILTQPDTPPGRYLRVNYRRAPTCPGPNRYPSGQSDHPG